jgi:hypothetical protein
MYDVPEFMPQGDIAVNTIIVKNAFPILCTLMVALWSVPAAGQTSKDESGAPGAAQKEYEKRAAKITGKNVGGWLKLADFCEANLLFDKREEALQKVISIQPNNADAHRRLDQVKYGGKWLPCAEAEAAEAKEHQAKGEVFYGSKWVSAKAAEGPRAADRKELGWEVQSRIDGKYCIVYSAAPYEVTRAIVTVIDNLAIGYISLYGKYKKLQTFKPLRVFLFDNYKAIASGWEKATHSAPVKGYGGGYVAAANLMLLSTEGPETGGDGMPLSKLTTDVLLGVSVHEATHAMDKNALGPTSHMPEWILEGRAYYAGYCRLGRQWISGAITMAPSDGRPDVLEQNYKTASLVKLLSMQTSDYWKNPAVNYTLVWSFTQFLMQGQKGKYREPFLKFVAGGSGKDSITDFERTVAKVSDLTGPYREYVEKEFLPALNAAYKAYKDPEVQKDESK